MVWTTFSSLLMAVPVAMQWRRGDSALNALGAATTVLSVVFHGTARRGREGVSLLATADKMMARATFRYVLVKSGFSASVCLCHLFIAVVYLSWLRHLPWRCYFPEDPEFQPLAVLTHMSIHVVAGLSYALAA